MAIEIIGSSGKKQDPNVIKQVLKYGEVTEKHECNSNGEYNTYSYNGQANKDDLEEDLENGGEKGWIRKYILKYKNAIWTVTITGLGILGYFGISSIVKYINDAGNKLRTVMSEGGGGENSSKIPVSETLSENAILQKQRDDFIQNARQYIHDNPLSPKNSDLEKLVRRMDKTTELDKIQRDMEYVQQYYSEFCGNTYHFTINQM